MLDILQDVLGRVSHLEESIRLLKDEVRKNHAYPTCGIEYAHYKEIIRILSNIEDKLSIEKPKDITWDRCL